MAAKPHCRFCGKPIAKATISVRIKDRPYDENYDKSISRWMRTINVEKLPQTLEECRRLTNLHIVAVKRDRKREYDITGTGYDATLSKGAVVSDRGIDGFSEWDGESYVDKFFCCGAHAKDFAYAVLNTPKYANIAMPDYLVAVAKKTDAA